ncbi:MAG: FHA domain-containing protein [Anaerolineae bacterium]|nr:FHA domain-containing protein [Anaerolineae bacterium]
MPSESQQAFLYFEEGSLAGEQIAIDKGSVILGRGGRTAECDIVLPERQVSRQHAEIYLQSGRYYLRDLGSKNGTYLNGRPVLEPVQLYDNDTIQIALCERIRFIGSDATLPLDEVEPLQGLHLDRESKRVWVSAVEVSPPLSPAQYRLLELLSQQVGRVCSRDEIVAWVWSEAERDGVTEQAIDALVRRLRDRLAEADPTGDYVVTVRGHGFRLDPSGGRR